MGTDQLLAMYHEAKYAAPVRRVYCPNDAYILEETDRGLHCKFCGWSESPVPPKFIPRVPDEV